MTAASSAASAADAHFSQSYAEARNKFLAAASGAGLAVRSHAHPLRGFDGESLALDVVCAGAGGERVLVVSSGCHGVEGFCGSGIQIALLHDGELLEHAARAGVDLLLIHALNPHGFSAWRRTTHENVDLNRNFHDFSQPLPRNDAYDDIADLVLPPQWPPEPHVEQALATYASLHGERALQTAITAGQHRHPQGLFYGGTGPTWSHTTLLRVLHDHAATAGRLGWIDLHTGLGPCGHGERIFAGADDDAAIARARAWWGAGVTSIYDGTSSAVQLSGLMFNAAYTTCPRATYTGLALEFGTVPLQETLDALREDQWCLNHAQASPDMPSRCAAARRRMRDAFYVDTPAWKQQVVEQGLLAIRQAIEGLDSSH